MGIAAGYDGQTLFFIFMGCIQHGGAFLRRIHEGLVDSQLRPANSQEAKLNISAEL